MKQLVTQGIVLSRTDFGEADRIITILTPASGKLRLMARGVRRIKSKLAGGIELFSVSDITYIQGKGEIGTLVSARLNVHYGTIVTDIDRVQLGYELIKLLNKATEDYTDEDDYFGLLQHSFACLNNPAISLELIRTWFHAQLIEYAGHAPNLVTDTAGNKLEAAHSYSFDFDAMSLAQHPNGQLSADHIKSLRLLFGNYAAEALAQVQGFENQLQALTPLVRAMLQTYIRI